MIHDKTLHKWINNTISPEELKQFKQRPEYEELLQLYDRTEDIEPPTFDANEMLANILATDKKEVVVEKPPAKVVAFPNWAKLAVAAALIGLVGLFFFPFDRQVQVATSSEETKEVRLPDGSKATLLDDSRIVYYKNNWQEKREVQLDGTATFSVEKGAPFTVITHLGSVDVLGTIFTVDARSQEFRVDCEEGRVAVSSANKKFKTEITANELVQIKREYMVVKTPDLIIMEDTKLSDILKEVKLEFGATYETGDADLTKKLTVKLPRRNLEGTLKILNKITN